MASVALAPDFLSVLNQYHPLLLRVCRVYCPEPGERQDLYQEIVLQLWRAGLAFVGALVLTVAYTQRQHLVHNIFTDPIDWSQTSLAALCAAVLGLLILMGQHQQQRRYGRHLDQLEAALRELGE